MVQCSEWLSTKLANCRCIAIYGINQPNSWSHLRCWKNVPGTWVGVEFGLVSLVFFPVAQFLNYFQGNVCTTPASLSAFHSYRAHARFHMHIYKKRVLCRASIRFLLQIFMMWVITLCPRDAGLLLRNLTLKCTPQWDPLPPKPKRSICRSCCRCRLTHSVQMMWEIQSNSSLLFMHHAKWYVSLRICCCFSTTFWRQTSHPLGRFLFYES